MPIGNHVCVDCKKKSPDTELNYSLLGLAGWREVRSVDAAGKQRVDWRCPTCWAPHKQRTNMRTLTNLPSIEALRSRKTDEE